MILIICRKGNTSILFAEVFRILDNGFDGLYKILIISWEVQGAAHILAG
ncbi:MAG: hypothetical protein H6608_03625 [Flavobacteriales bacterium]|nr:hypothetical protein [Bacteroidota bacterium]MCB9240196.1 hypothetical protein [Flavobacteriales bacterium]